jgi:hypothetical protein
LNDKKVECSKRGDLRAEVKVSRSQNPHKTEV